MKYIIEKYKNKIFDDKIFFAPDIPSKKLKNALKTYADIGTEIPLVLIDETVFGSAKAGILLTNTSIYIKDSNNKHSFSCLIEDIEKVSFKNYVLMKRLTVNETLEIDFSQPSKKALSLFSDMLLELSGIQIEEDSTSWSNIGVGVGIGALFGGPIGAAIGAAIGASLENKNASKIVTKKEDSPRIIFIVTLASIMAKMAKADGVITEDEAETISELFDDLNFEDEERFLAKNAFKNAKNDDFTIYEYASQYKEIADNDLKNFLYSALWLIVVSDGYIHPKEDEILQKIPEFLGLHNSKYDEYMNKFKSQEDEYEDDSVLSLKECYTVLGCESSDSMKVIKKSYLKLVAEYHPDKIQSKGLPESFIQFATEQMQKINFAYDEIKKARG